MSSIHAASKRNKASFQWGYAVLIGLSGMLNLRMQQGRETP